MNLLDYFKVIKHILKQIQDKRLVELYQELIGLLQQIQQSPSPELSEQLIQKRKEINDSLLSSNPKDWDYITLQIYKSHPDSKIIGNGGYERLKKIFDEYQTNVSGAIEQIQSLINDTNNLIQTINNTIQGIEPLIDKSESESIKNELIELVFDKEVKIDTFPQLEDYSHDWQEVLLTMSRLTGSSAEDVRLLRIQKNSPVVIQIDAISAVCLALTFVVERVLINYERIENIRKLKEERRTLEIGNQKSLKALEKDEVEIIEALPELVANESIKQFKNKIKLDGEVNVVKGFVKRAVEIIFNFIDKGGIVDIVKTSPNNEDISITKLGPKYTEITLIQQDINKIKLIEAKKQEKIKKEKEETEKKKK